MEDPHDLERFVDAQRGNYERAISELCAGRKRTHWMWFIFPQIAGLGFSDMAQRYAIASLEEARAYLRHPLLGERLRTCTDAVNGLEGSTTHEVFGSPDDMKFRSCMTLFAAAEPSDPTFAKALSIFFEGRADPLTTRLVETRR